MLQRRDGETLVEMLDRQRPGDASVNHLSPGLIRVGTARANPGSSKILEYQVGRLLADHHDRRVGIAGYDVRHD